MATRTPRRVIQVSVPVKERWTEYKAALQREEGRAATDDELLGALLEGVPLWQADLMLRAHMRSLVPATDESERNHTQAQDEPDGE